VTEEELIAIKVKGVPIVTELIRAYQETVESPYFQKLACILERARVEEKMAIGYAVEAANRQKDAVIKKMTRKSLTLVRYSAKVQAIIIDYLVDEIYISHALENSLPSRPPGNSRWVPPTVLF
jgi:hypothetical protein